MGKNFKYSLEEILDDLDGNGLVITNWDEIEDALLEKGIDLDSTVESEDE